MSDTETGALLVAVNALVPIYPDGAAPILRQALAALLGTKSPADRPQNLQAIDVARLPGQSPDTTTPPNRGVRDSGAVGGMTNSSRPRAVETPPAGQPHPASAPKATRSRRSPANNGRKSALSSGPAAAEWLRLRKAVRAEMTKWDLDMVGLAAVIGRSGNTVTIAMTKRTAPSRVTHDLLRDFVAGSLEAGESTPAVAGPRKAVDAPAPPPGNGAVPALPRRAAEFAGNGAASDPEVAGKGAATFRPAAAAARPAVA